MLDALSLLVGAAAGAGAALVLARRPAAGTAARGAPAAGAFQLTTGWRVSEFDAPVVVARDVQGVQVPAGTRVVASGLVDAQVQNDCDVRQAPPVRAEFVLDAQAGRALLLPGGARAGSLGLLTTDAAIVERLETEFRSLWDKAEPYLERYRIGELRGRDGVRVETEGEVQDVLPWKDGFMLRLEDQGHVLGVLVGKDPSALQGQRIVVRGQLGRDEGGYVVLEASDVRRVA